MEIQTDKKKTHMNDSKPVSAETTFVPPYQLLAIVSAGQIDRVKPYMEDRSNTIVVNRTNRTVIVLRAGVGRFECVVSWFSREPHHHMILCLDRSTAEFYIEQATPELTVIRNANGVEVAEFEDGCSVSYRVDLHPNAIMAYGE